MPFSDTQIIVLLKAPRAGLAKTRLAAAIGDAAALKAYRSLLEFLFERIASVTSVQLHFSPADAAAEIEHWLKPGWISRPQTDGDLGQRLVSAFESNRDDGFSKTIIIGSDCPYLDVTDLEEAALSLDQHDVVLGPANDGGYWLIGLKVAQPELFTGIHWGTGQVLQQTLDSARRAGLKHHLLRTLSDVDTVQDWNAFRSSLADRD
jgi:rSAM/selenodomain-associated transferase 1